MDCQVKLALVGNPNCGKSTLFNRLTGARAKVANLPGVTVAPSTARLKAAPDVELVDLPGTYSLHPRALDEAVTRDALIDPVQRPDGIVLVLDSANIKRNLYLCLQTLELGLPTLVVVNETDTQPWSKAALAEALGTEVHAVHALRGRGTADLEKRWPHGRNRRRPPPLHLTPRRARAHRPHRPAQRLAGHPRRRAPAAHPVGRGPGWLPKPAAPSSRPPGSPQVAAWPSSSSRKPTPEPTRASNRTSCAPTTRPDGRLHRPPHRPCPDPPHRRSAHPDGGLLSDFPSRRVGHLPMDLIDAGMGALMETVRSGLPAGWWADLLVDGLLAGIGGVVIFVPQIALLFGAVAALEESGYMTRVAFLNDRWMRALGLDGRATVPLLGGFACAIPAILSARTIPGKRERLLTILITPWMTCSARLPVYLFLIGFVVPDQPWGPGGLFNLQGLFLFSIYAAGLLAGLALAWILHHGLPKAAPTQFIQEWPPYRLPSLKRTLGRVGRQAKAFVVGAGQVIVIVSVLLWGLSNTAPSGFAEVDAQHEAALSILEAKQADAAAFEQAQRAWQAARMDASWSGKLGSWLEPVIAPLGYDGRMGVALIASFAAREVFVGTMATLYAAPDDDEGIGALKQRLAGNQPADRPAHPDGSHGLLAHRVLHAGHAVRVHRGHRAQGIRGWYWALIQAGGMTAIAYLGAWAAYALLSGA